MSAEKSLCVLVKFLHREAVDDSFVVVFSLSVVLVSLKFFSCLSIALRHTGTVLGSRRAEYTSPNVGIAGRAHFR